MGRKVGKKSRSRKLLVLLGLAGIGAAVASQRKKNLSPVAAWEAPTPTAPTAPAPTDVEPADVEPVETPAPSDVEPVETPAPDPAPAEDVSTSSTSEAETPEAETPNSTSDPLVDPIAEGAPSAQDDSGSFFEQVMAETEPPARPRRTRRTARKAPESDKPAE